MQKILYSPCSYLPRLVGFLLTSAVVFFISVYGGAATIKQNTLGVDLAKVYVRNTLGTDNSAAGFSLLGNFGWNLGEFEFGPVIGASIEKGSIQTTTTITGGGFLDYNIEPNNGSQGLIYGIGTRGTIEYLETKVSEGSASFSNVTLFQAGPFIKWFLVKSLIALRGDFVYESVSSHLYQTTATDVGFTGKAGLQVYF
jgi:hypothetical protein